MRNKVEVLAPAGNILAFNTAINNGADSVYLGLGAFNARTKADNFTLQELEIAIKRAHLFGVRVYIVFNTLLKNDEIPLAVNQIKEALNLGADAIILQDLGLLSALQRGGVKVETHASTQMGIHNLEGAKVAERLGFRRIILSRETLFDDIKKIRDGTNLELEFFVHGALCVAFSGNCYFSSLIMGQSGNRGRCNQLCRKQYTLQAEYSKVMAKGKGEYLLSPRDLYLANHLKTLIDAGITTFKIEGRLRRPEYVGEVTRVYKKAVLDLEQGNSGEIGEDGKQNLKIMFNRGDYCTAHLGFDKKVIIDKNHPSHIGVKIGTVQEIKRAIFGNISVIKFNQKAPVLASGDGLKFMRGCCEVGTSLVSNPNAITFAGNVMAGDEVRLTSSVSLNRKVLSAQRVLELKGEAQILLGETAKFTITDGETLVKTESQNKVQQAKGAPLVKEKLVFLSKTADENIVMRDIAIKLDENCFMSVGELKQMRNEAINMFKQERLSLHNKHTKNDISDTLTIKSLLGNAKLMQLDKRSIFIMVDSTAKITQNLINKSDYIVFNPSFYTYKSIAEFCTKVGGKAVINLPIIVRGVDLAVMQDIISSIGHKFTPKFIVNNFWGLEVCAEFEIILGYGLNLLNIELFKEQKQDSTDTFLPVLASLESQSVIKHAINYIYGLIPLMTLATCPINPNSPNVCAGECNVNDKPKKNFSLLDSTGSKFPLRQVKIKHCYTQVLNSLPLDNREVICFNDCSVLIDLTFETNPEQKLGEILSNAHSNSPHTHGNYKKKLY